MMEIKLQLFGGRGGSGTRGQTSTPEIGALTKIEVRMMGESAQYIGKKPLPPRESYPTFATYKEADAYANAMYENEIVNGIEVDVFKTGSQSKGTLRYVVGLPEDRDNKRLPKGYRWQTVYL